MKPQGDKQTVDLYIVSLYGPVKRGRFFLAAALPLASNDALEMKKNVETTVFLPRALVRDITREKSYRFEILGVEEGPEWNYAVIGAPSPLRAKPPLRVRKKAEQDEERIAALMTGLPDPTATTHIAKHTARLAKHTP